MQKQLMALFAFAFLSQILGGAVLRINYVAEVSTIFNESTSNLGDSITGTVFVDLDNLPDVVGLDGAYWYHYEPNPAPRVGLIISASGSAFSYSFFSENAAPGASFSPMISLNDASPYDSIVFQVTNSESDRMLVLGFEDSTEPFDLISGSQIPLLFDWTDLDNALFTLWAGGGVEFEANVTQFSVAVIPEPMSCGLLCSYIVFGMALRRRRRIPSA